MASADLRQELDCSICLTIYTDPVNLRCGHNFCRVCIDRVLNRQNGSEFYSCPQCRRRFRSRPTLQRNIALRNIVENFCSAHLDQKMGIKCSHCIHSPVPAVKSCLHCEASLCNDHLKIHSKSPEHVLTEPTTSMGKRKCSVHKELLKYYCTADAACICVSCSLAGDHQGHKVETLDEASERKKQKLRHILQKLISNRKENEIMVQSLQEHRKKEQEEVAGERERVTALITDLRRQLEDLEKRVLREISRQEERLLHPLSDLIQQLEIKKDDLSRKMGDIEKLCNMTDPLTVLQESHTGDLCDTEEGDNEDRERHDKLLHDGGGLDVIGISHTLHTGLSDMMKGVNVFFKIQEAADILLDVNTANNNLQLSDDRKTASRSDINQNRPETPERFQYCCQVLSSQSFSSEHYWDVDVSKSLHCRVGMCYPSIERSGYQSWIGKNNKSWAMASADLRQELDCSICLNTYTDPVNLNCGHNFCWDCIDCVLKRQDGSEFYSCPQCRKRFRSRPTLQRNITLRNIVDNFCSVHLDQEKTGIKCTYCIHYPVPAVKSCLHCEASLCNDHLKVHSKSPEHVLTEPTTSMEKRKCSIHKKILEYYCTADAACICVSCRLDGEHQGHKVETLDEASERKKQKLRHVLQKLISNRKENEIMVRSLQEHRKKVQEEVAGERERVTALITDLRRQLEDLEKRVLREISRQEERILHPLSDLIQQLEIKKDDLSRKMGDIEEQGNMTDPLTVLQESHTGDLCDTEEGDNEDRERHDKLLHDGGGLDVIGISHTLHTGLSDMMKGVNVFLNIQEAADILLDVNTAYNKLQISDDMKTASRSDIKQNRPETPERFQEYTQVLSSRRFSSGRHYWEVDVRGSSWWYVGMSYPSIERRGEQSGIGNNKKSWCVIRYNNKYFMSHDSKGIRLPDNISSNRVRIYLDYEAGKLSFYDLCDPIRHLHTFTTTFTEPLHAALCVGKGSVKISGDTMDMLRVINGLHVPRDAVLVTIDVEALYSSIPHDLGLKAVKKFLKEMGQAWEPYNSFVLGALEFILRNNIFTFHTTHYLQVQGVAMGTTCAPSYACLYLGEWERELFASDASVYLDRILCWHRYIDDIFLVWDGPVPLLDEFLGHLNTNEQNLFFTMTKSRTTITFLDLTIYRDSQGYLQTELFRKPTAGNSLIRANSFHPQHTIENIPRGQYLRAKRNCSTEEAFEKEAKHLKTRFLERGYKNKTLRKAYQWAKNSPRDLLMIPNNSINQDEPKLRITTQFSNQSKYLKHILSKHWHILKGDNRISKWINEQPQFSYKRSTTLKGLLCSSHFSSKPKQDPCSRLPKGTFKCTECNALIKSAAVECCCFLQSPGHPILQQLLSSFHSNSLLLSSSHSSNLLLTSSHSILLSAMASADLRQELDCSICLNTYTDPVNLRCGHNFCRVCIDRVLDTQDGSEFYSCPQCRKRFRSRPTLQRNITLRNIVENFSSAHLDQETGIKCSQCIHYPVPAVKSCLLCEASLCNDHLKVHSKSPEHVLTEPTTSMEKRKCSVHKKILEYYCTADAACICVSCSLAGEHQGHKVETLDEASERKKQKLRHVLQKLISNRKETEIMVRSLQEHRKKVQEDVAGERERVTALITDLRRQLEDLEKRVLREISRREERLLHPLSDLIQQLEIKKDHLSRKMGDIEKLCNMTDPLTVLQESHTGDLCDTEEGDNEDRGRHDKLLHDGGGLDVIGISHTLHTGLSDMMKGVNVFLKIQEAADILLDVNTAYKNLQISDDRKTALRSDIEQNHPETPVRFQYWFQVLSSQSFSSGRHYWDVDVSKSENCQVGMCYPSIERRGYQSGIGKNNKSWCLHSYSRGCYLQHNNKLIHISPNISSNRVRIYLDYEAGKLSFYDLCVPIRHLHTFTTTFTEPLHAVLCVIEGCVKISGGQEM
ncbi:LOW QUALITY PROTEIN: uncharacterized protein ACMZJ9_009403 [Mantella aurantiaca]